MAKKKETPALLHGGHIPTLHAYARPVSVMPTVTERYTGEKWIYFGKRNLYPQEILALVFACAPLFSCASTLARLIAGNGVKFYNKAGDEIEEARDVLINELLSETTEEQFLSALALDVSTLNACSMVVRRAAGGDIVRLDHLDVSRLRSGQMGDDDMINDYWWSSNWARQREASRYKPERLDRYDKTMRETAVIYSRGYCPGPVGDVYAIPWYLGILKAAENWTKIDPYNNQQVDESFSANVHLHTFTTRPDNELDRYDEKVVKAYTGSRGRGIWHTYGTPEEGAPILTPIPRSDHAGELDGMRDNDERVIYNGYGIPGILMGIQTKTGMDGASKALSQAQAQVMAMLVKPKQQMITKELVRVMNDKGLTDVWEARIDQLDLVDPGKDEVFARQAALRSITIDEYRERELELGKIPGGEKLLIEAGSQAGTAEPTGETA